MTSRIHRTGWMKDFDVISDDLLFMEKVAELHSVTQSDVPNGDDIQIRVDQVDGHYQVQCNGQTILTDSPVQVLQNILFEETDYQKTLFPLHGGGVETGGYAHLFLAPTHAGKTTLIAYLTKQGYPYINDDRILMDMDTLCVLPDPSPIHLRPESVPVLARYGCTVEGREIRVENIHRIAYLPEKVATTELAVGNIFFIERSPTENSCRDIPRDETIRLLLAGLISPKANDINRLKCAIRMASRCKKLVYSDMQWVSNLLEKGAFE